MKKKAALIGAIGFFILFLVFTALVIAVDVRPIGPNGSEVGLATVNGALADALGYNETWYTVSEYAGYISLAIVPCFACLGLFQAIKRKSIAKVDRHLFVLGSFYELVLATYCLFEVLTINYRPVLIDGELEASFPSTHTMLALCIMLTAIYELHQLIKSKKVLIATDISLAAIMAVIITGRFMSGVHWFSDIIASVLLSGAFVCFFIFVALLVKDKTQKDKETTIND